jgi:hypothetical protein
MKRILITAAFAATVLGSLATQASAAIVNYNLNCQLNAHSVEKGTLTQVSNNSPSTIRKGSVVTVTVMTALGRKLVFRHTAYKDVFPKDVITFAQHSGTSCRATAPVEVKHITKLKKKISG